jgi:hypothetical protein
MPAARVVQGGLAGGTLAAGKLGSKIAEETVDAARNAAKVAEEAAALKAIGQNNGTVAAKLDNSVLSGSDMLLANDLAARAKIRPDTSKDAYYIANTDQTVLTNNNFDIGHVLTGEVNAKGKATGYHAEFAADGAARITPGSTVTQNANGTYQAPVQIWDDAKKQWVDKPGQGSTFFPPSWSEARITYEVTEAFKNKSPALKGGWEGTTPSGIKVQFYWDPKNLRTTFFPLGQP